MAVADRLMVLLRKSAADLAKLSDDSVLFLPHAEVEDPEKVVATVSAILRVPLRTREGARGRGLVVERAT